MKMNIIKMILLIILACILSFGCATTRNFESLPLERTEFDLPYDILAEKYPEIPLYRKPFRGIFINTPFAGNLIALWGKPDSERKNWLYFPMMGGTLATVGLASGGGTVPLLITGGVAVLIRPVSPETYIWQRGNYCIETKVDTTFPNYKKRILYWNWTDLHTAEKVSKECKQFQQSETSSN